MRRAERGFTLLEVLVAFVIAALALELLYQGALGGLVATHVSARMTEAVSRAQSHLAAIGRGTVIVPGSQEGDDGGGFRWRTLIRRTDLAPLARGDDATVARGPHEALYAVTVWVSWQENGTRAVRLDSTRAAQAPPPAP